jgi:hypothetical protein
MIGTRIHSVRRWPIGCIVLAILVVLLVVESIVLRSIHPALAAIPFALGLVWKFRSWRRRVEFTLAEEALVVHEPGETIPYADLEGLQAPKRPANPFKKGRKHYAIDVIHRSGVLAIPARLSVPSDEVFAFLLKRFPSCGSRDVNPALRDYLREKERRHGRENVWTFVARNRLTHFATSRGLKAFFGFLFMVGVLWAVLGGLLHQPVKDVSPWLVIGMVCAFIGGMFWLILHLQHGFGGSVKKMANSSLVICPDGLAMVQGDLEGEMRWEELTKASLQNRSVLFMDNRIHTNAYITLTVEGVTLQILDVYDCPLPLIWQHVDHYWNDEDDEEGEPDSPPRRPAGEPEPSPEDRIRRGGSHGVSGSS